MSKHILMVVTTADKMKENHPTGLWLSEFGAIPVVKTTISLCFLCLYGGDKPTRVNK